MFATVHPDDPVARALVAELSDELAAQYGERDANRGRSDFAPDDHNPATDVFVIAYVDREPVGCGAIRWFADGVGEVKRMYVRRLARGQAVGSRLLARLEAHARDLGYQRLVLETGDEQTEALRLYAAAGYEPTACWPPYDVRDFSRCFTKALPPRASSSAGEPMA